jgi:hypothetical protein
VSHRRHSARTPPPGCPRVAKDTSGASSSLSLPSSRKVSFASASVVSSSRSFSFVGLGSSGGGGVGGFGGGGGINFFRFARKVSALYGQTWRRDLGNAGTYLFRRQS